MHFYSLQNSLFEIRIVQSAVKESFKRCGEVTLVESANCETLGTFMEISNFSSYLGSLPIGLWIKSVLKFWKVLAKNSVVKIFFFFFFVNLPARCLLSKNRPHCSYFPRYFPRFLRQMFFRIYLMSTFGIYCLLFPTFS